MSVASIHQTLPAVAVSSVDEYEGQPLDVVMGMLILEKVKSGVSTVLPARFRQQLAFYARDAVISHSNRANIERLLKGEKLFFIEKFELWRELGHNSMSEALMFEEFDLPEGERTARNLISNYEVFVHGWVGEKLEESEIPEESAVEKFAQLKRDRILQLKGASSSKLTRIKQFKDRDDFEETWVPKASALRRSALDQEIRDDKLHRGITAPPWYEGEYAFLKRRTRDLGKIIDRLAELEVSEDSEKEDKIRQGAYDAVMSASAIMQKAKEIAGKFASIHGYAVPQDAGQVVDL